MLVRAESAARLARVRSLIEQLDTPGRAGGNIFIIYLKNAEAVRVAATLRSLLTGGSDVGASTGLSAMTGAALGATSGGVGSTALSATGASGERSADRAGSGRWRRQRGSGRSPRAASPSRPTPRTTR